MTIIRIGTHDGLFHMDELLGVATIRLLHMDEVEIVRSRDPKVLADCQYLVDVGREYDPKRGRYDHHQKGGAGRRPNGNDLEYGVEYASAGLVWKHHGATLCGGSDVAEIVDRNLMQHVDYRDNHGPQGRGQHVFELADALTSLLPTWDEDDVGGSEDDAFMEALRITETILERAMRRAESEIKAQHVVRDAIKASDQSKIVILEQGCPWQEVVINEAPNALLMVIGNQKKGEWLVQCIPKELGKNDALRVRLPEAWGGISTDELRALTGVADATFAHRDRWVCGAASRHGAIALANLALKSA